MSAFYMRSWEGLDMGKVEIKAKSMTVLIVDDSPAVRAVLSMSLRIGHVNVREIYEAHNGKEALKLMKAHEIDLVFTDLNMPEMDGTELIRAMWNDRQLRSIPVVVVCYSGKETNVEELEGYGVKAFMPKPFTPDKLVDVVNKVTAKQNGTSVRDRIAANCQKTAGRRTRSTLRFGLVEPVKEPTPLR